MEGKLDCGDCTRFVESAAGELQSVLDRYQFRSVDCDAQRDGRECVWMLESDRCRMLVTLSDGQEDCSLGAADADFPPNVMLKLNGELGWYNALHLIQFKSGKQLMTRKLIKQFVERKRSYFEWLAPLLEQWMDELIPMFEAGGGDSWRDDYLAMLERMKPA